jgi:hypothetical protein
VESLLLIEGLVEKEALWVGLTEAEPHPVLLWLCVTETVLVALGEGEAEGQIDGLMVRDTVGLLVRDTVSEEEREPQGDAEGVNAREEVPEMLALGLALLQPLPLGLPLVLDEALGLRD